MADEIVAKYRVDVTEASKNLTDLANASVKASDAMAKSGKVATDSFLAGSNGAKRLEAELARQPKTLAEMELKLRNLKELLRDDTRIGTEGFKQVTKAIKETEAAIEKANGKLEETKNKGVGVIGTFKNVAAAIGIAFGVQQIISFGKEAVQLAAKAEGVERAFARIGSPSLLEGLRAATRGTVTDLVLMQNAVKADNFKIPLEQLGSLFAFAQQRSRATGESVDYLVDSIILGIGRKSIPILDNLGISAVELKEKLGDTAKGAATIGDVAAAVGKIAQESLQKTGVEADTTADKLAQLSTIWSNFMVNVGDGLIMWGTGLAYIAGLIEPLNVKQQVLNNSVKSFKEIRVSDLASGYRDMSDIVDEMTKKQTESNRLQETLIAIQTRLKALQTGSRAPEVQNEITQIQERIKVINLMIERRGLEVKVLAELYREEERLAAQRKREEDARLNSIKNVFYYTEAIKALNEKINAEGTAVEDIMPLLKQRAEMQVELTRLTTEQATGINRLNAEMSALQDTLKKSEIGSLQFFDTLEKIKAKQSEIDTSTFLIDESKRDYFQEALDQDAASLKENTKLRLDILKEYNALVEDLADELAVTSNELLDRQTQNIINNAETRRNIAFKAASEEQITAEQYSQAIIDIDAAEKAQLITAQEAHNARIFELNKKLAEDEDGLRKQKLADEEDMWNEIASKVREYGAIAMQINSLISEASRIETEKELMALESALEAGQITREQYDQERRRLLAKQASDEKSANIFSAIISTAAAVADALPNIPLSIIAAALGAAQIAVIASQPIPKFAEGGWVDAVGRVHGRKHAQGGVKIEAEGDEFIVKGARAKQYPNIIEAVNNGTIMQLIKEAYVAPAINAAMFNGFQDIGKSADLNGITAKLSDHNIIAAMDRNRQATTYGLAMIAEEIRTGKRKNRRGYA
jgi:hypothetical protein